MRFFSKTRSLWHIWTLSSALSLVSAQAIDLGIRRDASLKTGSSQNFPVLYSAALDFPAGAVDTDQRLAWLAWRAHEQMRALPNAGSPPNPSVKDRPAIMAALRVNTNNGVRVYLASSMRKDMSGIDAFIYKFLDKFPNEARELQGSMNICQVTRDGGGHNKDAHCGEPMALAAFYKENGPDTSIQGRDAVIAAYLYMDEKNNVVDKIIKPCTWGQDGEGGSFRYGCIQLTGVLGVRFVDAGSALTAVTQSPTKRPQVCLAS